MSVSRTAQRTATSRRSVVRRGTAALTLAAAVAAVAAGCGETPGTTAGTGGDTTDASVTPVAAEESHVPSLEDAVLLPAEMPPLWASEERPWQEVDTILTDDALLFACQQGPLTTLGADGMAVRTFRIGAGNEVSGVSAVLEFADDEQALAALAVVEGWLDSTCEADVFAEPVQVVDLGPLTAGEQPAVNVSYGGVRSGGTGEGLFEWVAAAVDGDRMALVANHVVGNHADYDPEHYPAGPTAPTLESAIIRMTGTAG